MDFSLRSAGRGWSAQERGRGWQETQAKGIATVLRVGHLPVQLPQSITELRHKTERLRDHEALLNSVSGEVRGRRRGAGEGGGEGHPLTSVSLTFSTKCDRDFAVTSASSGNMYICRAPATSAAMASGGTVGVKGGLQSVPCGFCQFRTFLFLKRMRVGNSLMLKRFAVSGFSPQSI